MVQAELANGANPQDSSDLGYSLVAGSNTFVDLNQVRVSESLKDSRNNFLRSTNQKQVLHDEDEFQVITAAHNRPYFRSHVLERNVHTLVSNLPPKPIIEELSAVFFDEVNWHYFILERFYFDDMLSHWQTPGNARPKYLTADSFHLERKYFPAVVFQVLALTLQFLPPGTPSLSRLPMNELASSQKYSDIGDELVTLLGRQHGVFTALQADFLRSSWLKNFGRGIESWHNLASAVRSVRPQSSPPLPGDVARS